jgi:poly(A)-specific ribonuclease
MFPSRNNDDESDDFEEHLRKIASLSDKPHSPSKELKVSELEKISKKFLRRKGNKQFGICIQRS